MRVLNGAGTSVTPGHQDDISSVAFSPPNSLATASIDGTIIVWNLESGYFKCVLRDPYLNIRLKEERPVEKILFVSRQDKKSSYGGLLLFSCHADGTFRIWEPEDGKLIDEVMCIM
jgi:WD40 repeat protein